MSLLPAIQSQGHQSTNSNVNYWPGLALSSSTRTCEGVGLHCLCQLSDASTIVGTVALPA